ncbi:NAD(P)-dependent oxidoreductase [Marinobacter sp. M216]|uniref:NAD(P)-dependent oxidoreductase n=1 Tax=Marinobacter albus TaxID=3030833 RepID=A0ABT7HFY1_9GAMM|nr:MULTISPECIES: NAD(P)-dependent oxidoreductase [unclassified Marinobacter]MBW7472170.1 NAD(P)-dependent oxidoreductase [Marinobacter sp. F4218]MDK9558740.1 NAD(P)-dependent oxidoreductase [Marinobacter sp. M216]
MSLPTGRDGQKPSLPSKVFITGANGFIGRTIYRRYRELGCEVCGMDLQADEERNVIAGDLTNPSGWRDHAKGCDLFINTAAVVSLAADWETYSTTSLVGVRNALDVAIAGGAQRFVHFSSIAAMGYDYEPGADETAPVVIGEHYRYGVAKGASEHTVLAAHAAGEIDCTIIRPGDVYGPGSRPWLLEPLKMARAGQLILPNRGKGIFTPVYIDDLVDGTLLAAGLPAGSGRIFILWGDEPVTCREFFMNHWRWAGNSGFPPSMPLAAALKLTQGIWWLNRTLKRPNEVTPDAMLMFARKGGFSIENARKHLGFEPKVNLEEGMKRSEAWLREMGELSGTESQSFDKEART